MKSLYIHFPFCESRCHYCDFYSIAIDRAKPTDPSQYETALKAEIQQKGPLLSKSLDTIFFGGGTPSMTPYDSMTRALESLWKFTSIHSKTEWTMEANPSSIRLENFKNLRSLGINRISMGVQALRPDLLEMLGRVHSESQALHALSQVFDAGFSNVSVDLLCGVPGQSIRDLENALSRLSQFPITHLSCYLLTLPPHHKMYSSLPNEDEQLTHLLFIHDWMTSKGFEHYEISNFAKPGFQAAHNLQFWKGSSYLGLGPSAHSFDHLNSKRWKNVSSLHKYSTLLATGQSVIDTTETLSTEQLELEKWMLALRLSDGFPSKWLISPNQIARAEIFVERGLLEQHPLNQERMRLTPKGFALSDQVISSLA